MSWRFKTLCWQCTDTILTNVGTHRQFQEPPAKSKFLATITASQAATTVLCSENFNQTDGTYTTFVPEVNPNSVTNLRSWGGNQSVSGNQLLSVTGSATPNNAHGGLRFGTVGPPFNWASGATGAAITAAGGFTVAFNWTESSLLTVGLRWIGWKVGTPSSQTNSINDASIDYAVLLADMETFRNLTTTLLLAALRTGQLPEPLIRLS